LALLDQDERMLVAVSSGKTRKSKVECAKRKADINPYLEQDKKQKGERDLGRLEGPQDA
jgi:hypothetical protein